MDKYCEVSYSSISLVNYDWKISFRDKDELENFIKILITDSIVRKKFPGKDFFCLWMNDYN
jgi:hypothetical protein